MTAKSLQDNAGTIREPLGTDLWVHGSRQVGPFRAHRQLDRRVGTAHHFATTAMPSDATLETLYALLSRLTELERPEWVMHPDHETSYKTDDLWCIADDMERNEVLEVRCYRELPEQYLAIIHDDATDSDEPRLFATEDAAKSALAASTPEGRADAK